MPRSHLGVFIRFAFALALASALLVGLPACSDDARSPSAEDRDGALEDAAVRHDGATPSARGGADTGSGGTEGRRDAASAGEGGRTGAGGDENPGTGGEPSNVPDAGCEPLDVADAAVERQLSLCVRLRSASVHAFDVTRAFDHAVYADCRVSWLIDLYLKVDKRADYLNKLLAWNMQFWGCNPPAPTDFALIFEPAPLSAADVAALIDIYIEVTTPALDLSALEIADMRAALTRLAAPLIADRSCRFSRSSCATATGTGGAGGGGAGAGGAGDGGAANGGSGGAAGAGSGGAGAGNGGAGGDNGGAAGSGGTAVDGGSTRSDASSAGVPDASRVIDAGAGGEIGSSTP